MINGMYIMSAGLEFFFALVSVILLTGCMLDSDRGRKTNRILIAILVVNALMNAIDACIWLWCDVLEMITVMKILSFLSYGLGSALFALFSYLVVCIIREYAPVPGYIPKIIIVISAVMALLWVISMFNGMYYYWDENGVCQIGEMHFLSQAFGILFLILNIVLAIRYREAITRRVLGVLILYSAIPLISFAFVSLWDVLPVYTASTISLLLYYIVVHVEHGQRVAKQQTQLVRQELELNNSRTAMMLSQVRPHFLYNTLTAIAQLCEKDPKKAKETTIYFSEYLRSNMKALEQTHSIPFEKELEHVRAYLAIEQVRFADELRVLYDIQTMDFFIPPLCLQPLVENAVKHGVGMKEDGGTVLIRSRELGDNIEITVEDDGVGFDPAKRPQDGKSHIGIENVRERLAKMADAGLVISSNPGSGTVVVISIPKKG
ncbi:MAG: histidine kinase [Clostridia bacterium]|nr:histidine kinase [Clostridia bacterium]